MDFKLPLVFTKDKQDFVLENYPKMTYKELTEAFNKRFNTTYSYWYLKRKIVPAIYREHNMRPIDVKPSRFQKGHDAYNYKEVGSERWDSYSNSWMIKTSDSSTEKNKGWVRKNRVMYEKYNGKLPKNYAVIFKNGNKNDFSKENLVAVPTNYLRLFKVLDLIKDEQTRIDMFETILLVNKIYDRVREIKEK